MVKLKENKLIVIIVIPIILTLILVPVLFVANNKNNDAISRISNSINLMETMPFVDLGNAGATSFYITISTIWPDMTSKQKIEYHFNVQGIFNYSSSTGSSLSIEPIPNKLLHFSNGLINFHQNEYRYEWSDLEGNHSILMKANKQYRADIDTDFERTEKNISTSFNPGYFEITERYGFDTSGFDNQAHIELIVANSVASEWFYGVKTNTTTLKQLVQIRFTIQIKLLTKSLFGWNEVEELTRIYGGDLYDDLEVTYPIWLVPYII